LKNLNAILRTAVLVAAVLLAGWWTLTVRAKLNRHEDAQRRIEELDTALEEREGRIAELASTLEERERHIEELDRAVRERDLRIQELGTAMRLLKVDHRLARLEVLEQTEPEEEGEPLRTRLRFTELGPDGEPIGPGRELTVAGGTVYVETLVVKFEDALVESGDPLRGTAICLFRRLFGSEQRPSEGVALDPAGVQPLAYGGEQRPDPMLRDLWQRFWEYANDPELAASRGVRAIHGEAPFIEVRPGRSYRIELRSSGGLTIRPE
jgi:hypothetical protein